MYRLIKSKAIIDGTGRPPVVNGCLLIKNGWIEEVGLEEDFDFPRNEVEIIDLSQYYLLPGLIDSHNHLSIDPGLGDQLGQMRMHGQRNILRSMPNIKKSLASGVTTMRIVGEENFIDIDIKKAIQEKLISGPRLLVSGRGLVATNGHGAALTVSDGEEEIRRHARQNLAHGADLLKIFVTGGVSSTSGGLDSCSYSSKEIAVAVEEAERAGTYVAAHAHGGKGIDLCIQEGVRTIEHAAFISDNQIDEVLNNDLWIIGTFSILFHKTGIEQTDFSNPEIREKVLQAREMIAENFNKVIKSGANVALGTDSMHGLIAYEMECFVNFGATPMQAIMAVTKNAASAIRMEDKLGTLERGKIADFIGVNQNPLENIKHMQHVDFVYQSGERQVEC